MKESEVKKIVREGYARRAKGGDSCCTPRNSCCGSTNLARERGKNIGYSDEELEAVPEGSNLGLGCGNPIALASLKEGETVLDLGSGAGFDCFLAANKVGKDGKVIGVDMTPEMVEKARENARKDDYANVEFRLGEIENLPVADESVDVIISNCVINLSPDKRRVFAEAFRALKPGGRLMISDIVLLKALPQSILNSIEAYVGCIAGAVTKDEYIESIKTAGFNEIGIVDEASFPVDHMADDPTTQAIVKNLALSLETARELMHSVVSVKVSAVKPN